MGPLEKKCIGECGKVFIFSPDHFPHYKNTKILRDTCKECRQKEWKKEWTKINKEKIIKIQQKHYQNNKEIIKARSKQYELNNIKKVKIGQKRLYQKNKEKIKANSKKRYEEKKEEILIQNKEYRKKNKLKIREDKRTYTNKRLKEDVQFKLRSSMSNAIFCALKNRNLSKNNKSFLHNVDYTIGELKQHLESLFEPWMTWDKWGKYDSKTWDDNDPTTWKWQIDHIIPQIDFIYSSIEDEEFKKCWALSNLRPYSAKLNIIEGTNRTRHKKNQRGDTEEFPNGSATFI